MQVEQKKRTVLKSLTWRITATLTTTSLVYYFTGKLDTAIEIGLIEVFLKMYIYYLHERLWARVKFGIGNQPNFVIVFTGLSGSGKSRIAEKVYEKIEKKKKMKVEYFNGERIREVFPQTGFSPQERKDHIQKVTHFVQILEKNQTNVIVCLEAPFEDSRQNMRKIFTNYIEIYINTPLDYCLKNDRKGFYAKALSGEIKDFVGVSIDYEPPTNPELTFNIEEKSIENCSNEIISYLKNKKFL
ncbi:MAG: adenylyl-sulfate kinase [Calditrichaeota bacterium]|nr:MAG: adenylyl-sulfate kinase [Calditrichota bacterium]